MGIYIEHTIREEGIEIGKEETMIRSIESLLQSKFFKQGIMTYEDIAKLQEIEVERVNAIHSNMKK